MSSIAASILGIVICGSFGGFVAARFAGWLDLNGTAGALLAALLGTLIATMAFAAGTALLRWWGWLK
jgi:hypothetical protein